MLVLNKKCNSITFSESNIRISRGGSFSFLKMNFGQCIPLNSVVVTASIAQATLASTGASVIGYTMSPQT